MKMLPDPNDPNIIGYGQSIEFIEPNPRLVGMAETILQQNAAILAINQQLTMTLLSLPLVLKTHIERRDPEEAQE
jgi:hypothetical protein